MKLKTEHMQNVLNKEMHAYMYSFSADTFNLFL